MWGSAKKDSRSRTDKLLSAISLNLGAGTDNQVAIGAAADSLGLAAETAVQEALSGRLPGHSHGADDWNHAYVLGIVLLSYLLGLLRVASCGRRTEYPVLSTQC
jgi:hypothetical protein